MSVKTRQNGFSLATFRAVVWKLLTVRMIEKKSQKAALMMSVPTRTKILIVDEHPLVRDGLKWRLASREDWIVCGEAEMAAEAIRMVEEQRPDVVIIDLSLKNGDGLELIKKISAFPDAPKILVCSMHDEKLFAQRAVQAGALGFVHKQQASEKIVAAVERVLEGKLFVSEEVLDTVLSRVMRTGERRVLTPVEQLTDRELQVFEAIGHGMTVQQIAQNLFLSNKTVETYRDRTKRKLSLRTSAELMHYAIRWVTANVGN